MSTCDDDAREVLPGVQQPRLQQLALGEENPLILLVAKTWCVLWSRREHFRRRRSWGNVIVERAALTTETRNTDLHAKSETRHEG